MKTVEISDADYEALELLAKVHDVDVQLALNDLINIGCKTYKAHIDEYRAVNYSGGSAAEGEAKKKC